MKFVIKQEKLTFMLDKLLVGDMFPSSVMTTRDGTLFSIQREERGRSLRMLKLQEKFFESIDKESNESIEIDTNKFLKTVKRLPPGMVLTCETKGNKLSILGHFKDGRETNPQLTIKQPEGEILSKLPFTLDKEKNPVVKNTEGIDYPLDVHILLNIPDFKEISDNASAIKTEFYSFNLIEKKLHINVGDVNATSDNWTFQPSAEIKSGEDLNVIFTYGIPQISSTFGKNVSIHTATDSPGWFFEQSGEHALGVFIPPYTKSTDE